jgi:hypothetical protein
MDGPTERLPDDEWVAFPGGELEGRRPRTLCPACRARRSSRLKAPETERPPRTICFQCYLADFERRRALGTAGEAVQPQLPLEPVHRARLEALKAERATTRAEMRTGARRFEYRRRLAQIAARYALRSGAPDPRRVAAAMHAAELQLPESWMPFVVSR